MEERGRWDKKKHLFWGQDFLCEPLGIILDELVRLWVQMETPAVAALARPRQWALHWARSSLVGCLGLKSIWDDGFWIVGLPLNQSWGIPRSLPRCPDFRRWATALARVFKKSIMQCPFHSWALLWSYQENPWPFWLGGEPGPTFASLSSGWARAVTRPWVWHPLQAWLASAADA